MKPLVARTEIFRKAGERIVIALRIVGAAWSGADQDQNRWVFAFTGGPETARHIVRGSAENLAKVSLELGLKFQPL